MYQVLVIIVNRDFFLDLRVENDYHEKKVQFTCGIEEQRTYPIILYK